MFCHLGLANESVFPSNEKRNRKSKPKPSRELEDNPNERKFYRSTSVSRDSVVTLTEAVAMSRESCELEYLIGAAPVVYGVPVFFK